MSIIRRPSKERGRVSLDWLESRQTFSFAHYFDPARMGFRRLRIINEDVVSPATGFGTHGHRDMEIVSYVIGGRLVHEDTAGNKATLHRGDVQAMSAGTGIRHSECNGSARDEVRFLQLWFLPRCNDLPPAYRQAHFSDGEKQDRLRLIVSPDGVAGSLSINQDVRLYASLLDRGKSLSHQLAAGRGAWLQVIQGSLIANDANLLAGDGAAIENIAYLDITALDPAEFLLIDLA